MAVTDDTSSHTPRRRPFLASVLPHLTTLSHTSALVFSSFLVVHLASPLSATAHLATNASTTGSTDTASKWQLLGRVYYQNEKLKTENIFVWGALGVHLLSSIAKRAIIVYQRWRREKPSDPAEELPFISPDARKPNENLSRGIIGIPLLARPSLHTFTSYALAPLLLHHVLLHRILPSSSSHPINELSPSDLDHNFTSYGLQRYPFISWTILSALTIVGGIHVAGGVGIIGKRLGAKAKARARYKDESINTRPKGQDTRSPRKKKSPVPPTLLVASLILTGAWAMFSDADSRIDLQSSSPSYMVKRVRGR